MTDKKKTLVLVDGSALAFRSFYAFIRTGLRSSDGTPTWAVFGFLMALISLLEQRKPDMIAVCFDLAEPTFRHIEYTEYKANRAEMPDDLSVQWPLIKEAVTAFDIPLYELAGYEADDVIGTVAVKAAKEGYEVIILTGDQDAFQLLSDNIHVLMPGQKGLNTFGRQEVFAKLGVYPEQVIDYKALCGDSSDNIPGVKGIGPKGAVNLLTRFQNLKTIYENLDQVESASLRQKLIDGKDSAFSSQGLATIRLDVPLDFDFKQCHLTMPKPQTVADFLQKLEFKSILKQLPDILSNFNGGQVLDVSLANLSGQTTASAPAGTATLTETASGGQLALDLNIKAVEALPQLETNIVLTEKDLDDLIEEIKKQSILSVDLETTGLDSLDTKIVGYALAYADGACLGENGRIEIRQDKLSVKQAYIPVGHFAEKQLDNDLVVAKLKPILEDTNIGKIAQNAKFEMNVLSLYGINFGPLAFDPMLASYIVNPDNKHGLKDQSAEHLNHEMVRITELIGSGRNQMTMDQIPIAKVAPYAADDARVALELARYYLPKLTKEQSYLLWEMDMPLSAVLAKMEQAGVALDKPYLSQFSQELTGLLANLEKDIFAQAGHPLNLNSPKQLQNVLFEELKLKPKGSTKSGYSTDAHVLESLADEHPIVKLILDFRQLSKLRSTYVEALPLRVLSHTGRLHGEFNQTITSTGRLSSSNPNLQNIPIRTEQGRRIRRSFIAATPDHSLISADYSQIELRLLAEMSKDATLIDAFQKDQDIHARTAMEIFDVDLDAVTSDMRRVGKTINFSLIYQQGAYSTAQDLGISPKEAQAFIDKYFSRYPGVLTYMKASIDEARANGYAQTLWGRRRYFRNLNDRNDNIRKADERAASNSPLQGSAADLMKLAMIKLDNELTKRKLSGKLILQVHDELVLDVPDKEIEETKKVVLDCMTEGFALKIPLKVDIRVGKTWAAAK
jgi:DNA polymerase-1